MALQRNCAPFFHNEPYSLGKARKFGQEKRRGRSCAANEGKGVNVSQSAQGLYLLLELRVLLEAT
jgi:hypothetical protein